MKPIYKALLKSNSIKLTGNSQIGLLDYARWLEEPMESMNLIRNGVHTDNLIEVDEINIKEFKKLHEDSSACYDNRNNVSLRQKKDLYFGSSAPSDFQNIWKIFIF